MRIFMLLLICCPVILQAQQRVTLLNELNNLSDPSLLPQYRTGTIQEQTSSYDRTGGNNDGFNGTYSFVRRNPDSSLVLLDIKGPGVINRFTTPTPTNDTLDFYIDDSTRPVMSVNYHDWFMGNIKPFVKPLADTGVGGYFSYYPILFQHFCKIVSRGKLLSFHQVQYRLFPEGTAVQPFSLQLSAKESALLKRITEQWKTADHSISKYYSHPKLISEEVPLRSGQTQILAELSKAGRILAIELDPSSAFTDTTRSAILRITWDNENTPAVECPIADFFGYAFGQPSMQSLLLGSDKRKNYCLIPMPFDSHAKIELINKGTETIHCSARIYYSDQARNEKTEGKFYVNYLKEDLDSTKPFHTFLNIRGKGHYVGTILQAEGFQRPGTLFFEGDDSTNTDGVFRMHGTGSEDYFNGGWYAIKGRWDTARSMPLSGCLLYSERAKRTGGYRLFINDKIPFEQSIYHGIEHGPDAKGIPARYTSVALYYADRPKEQQEINNGN